MKEELKDAPVIERMKRDAAADGSKVDSFPQLWRGFLRESGLWSTSKGGVPFEGVALKGRAEGASVMDDLRNAFRVQGQRGLDNRIKYAFYGHITGARFTDSELANQQAVADLRYPSEWYPATRSLQRVLHLHVGPTNSGKTYHALKRLEEAEKGVYAGPLRLLAHEVYTRMNARGKLCALVTGEERRVPEAVKDAEGYLTSCTVEMVPLNMHLDVAVIDEIQMIGSNDRGWAWTQALLGLKAKEVHLCGEERTVPLIREIAASLGEKLVIHHYKRLSPLQIADQSLNGNLTDLRKGDCIVSFSVIGIHALRKQIERDTGRKVAIVYGSLPPETRAAQARLFNDPDNDYDFLVASDAVGMGLNLAIKRIIFEASNKWDGSARRTLSIADIKQIAGRAGRYRTAAQATQKADEPVSTAKGEPVPANPEPDNVGIVTTLEKFDFPVVRSAMSSEAEPILSAGLAPPSPVLERFSSYFPPGTPFSYILTRLHELCMMHKRFHLCALKDHVWLADLIEPIEGLTVVDRNIICACPATSQTGGNIADIPELPLEVLEQEASPNREYLKSLETLHKGVVSYLWLSFRFAGIFNTRALANHIKDMVEQKIEEVLDKFSFTEAQRRKIAEVRQKQVHRDEVLAAQVAIEDEAVDPAAEGDDTQSANGLDTSEEHGAVHGDVEVAQSVLDNAEDRLVSEEDLEIEAPDELDILADNDSLASKLGVASTEDTERRSSASQTAAKGRDVPLEKLLSEAMALGESEAAPPSEAGINR
ncbi:RNA helicase [Oleoguttula sp. CCFEE 5521]